MWEAECVNERAAAGKHLCLSVWRSGRGRGRQQCSALLSCCASFVLSPPFFFSWASPAQQRKQSRLLLWPPQNSVKQKRQNGSSWGYQREQKANVGCGNKWWSKLLIRKYLYVWPLCCVIESVNFASGEAWQDAGDDWNWNFIQKKKGNMLF